MYILSPIVENLNLWIEIFSSLCLCLNIYPLVWNDPIDFQIIWVLFDIYPQHTILAFTILKSCRLGSVYSWNAQFSKHHFCGEEMLRPPQTAIILSLLMISVTNDCDSLDKDTVCLISSGVKSRPSKTFIQDKTFNHSLLLRMSFFCADIMSDNWQWLY